MWHIKKIFKKLSASVCGGFYDYYKYDEEMRNMSRKDRLNLNFFLKESFAPGGFISISPYNRSVSDVRLIFFYYSSFFLF